MPIALTVESSVFFVEQAGALEQEFVLSTDGIRPGAQVRIEVHAGADVIDTLTVEPSPLGTIEQAAHLPPATQARELTFTLSAGDQSATVAIVQKPCKKWRIYVAPTVHVDIGYTHLQRDVVDI